MKKTEIILAYFHVSIYDAIGYDIVMQYKYLKRIGYKVSLYAQTYGVEVVASKLTLSKFVKKIRKSNTCLFLHHGNYWEEVDFFLEEARCQVVLRYHGITPGKYFTKYNPKLEIDNRKGLIQFDKFVKQEKINFGLPTSPYTKNAFIRNGFNEERIEILAPFSKIEKYHNVDCDYILLKEQLRGNKKNLLFVGRFTPHKGQLFLIDVIKEYLYRYDHDVRLNIVGGVSTELKPYYDRMMKSIYRSGLMEYVNIHIDPTDEMIQSYMLSSHLYISGSEHEGFGLTFIEAQSNYLPVVAYGASAVNDTLGKDQLVLKERNAYLFSSVINKVLRDHSLLLKLAEKGKCNSKKYLNGVLEARLNGFLKLAGI